MAFVTVEALSTTAPTAATTTTNELTSQFSHSANDTHEGKGDVLNQAS